jgi:hypothetical protein
VTCDGMGTHLSFDNEWETFGSDMMNNRRGMHLDLEGWDGFKLFGKRTV